MRESIKIAVSLSGMPRNFDKCCKNTFKFFDADNVEVDFFIHAWNNDWYEPRAKSPKRSMQTSETLDTEDLKESLTKTYSPKSLIVEDQRENEDIKTATDTIIRSVLHKSTTIDIPDWLTSIVDPSQNYNYNSFLSSPLHLSQTYSISKSATLVHEYSIINQKKYDLVFRFRFDNFVEILPKKLRTKLFHDMVSLIEWANEQTKKLDKFRRDYLFPAWITVVGENGFARNTTWIGDKMFSCSANSYRCFEKYFDSQVARILSYDIGQKGVSEDIPYFMPEQTMYEMCLKNKLFVHGTAYLNSVGLVSYRDYHLSLEDQSFKSLQDTYRGHEKMNHDSSDGIVVGL